MNFLFWANFGALNSICLSMINQNPFLILQPNERWAPSQDQFIQSDSAYEKLLPPLVYMVRKAVFEWRESGYPGCSDTTLQLLRFWFEKDHKDSGNDFRFFYAQREAVESIIFLYEVAKARDKFELMRYDSSGRVSGGMFDESWTRYVVKMATGAGKTKVIGLTLVWSFFHKCYEAGSDLSRNFLLIAPNIIVLNRLLRDFEGLRMFNEEPFVPENGYMNRDWKNDFQLTVHVQDDLKPITETGNLFLSNIHRVFFNAEPEESLETVFLGTKPKADADTSKGLDLGKLLRSHKLEDLVVLNDEAHHIHDSKLEWFKSIQDINHKLKLKSGHGIALQADFSATPKHNNGAIFVQTISDYPLVEAIWQRVVKTPVLPDESSRQKIHETDSSDFIERYRDHIHLGYIEWERQYEELKHVKVPILFVMTMNTAEADQTAEYLEQNYPLLKNSVLSIHTNNAGEIKESSSSKKDKEELDLLRKAANDIDSDTSPYKAVVSVLILREGWDVRNVTTIVGLRPFKADSKILPEQTIGRGLRKMFSLEGQEKLVVVGTQAFLEFVESLKTEGVEFEYSPMGPGAKGKTPIIIEVDEDNPTKDLEKLDIPLPVLTPRLHAEYKQLSRIDINTFKHETAPWKSYSPGELKEIVFEDIDGEFSHKTIFSDSVPDHRNVLQFFTSRILKESRLVGGFDILYPKVESFIRYKLFGREVGLAEPQTMRNLSEVIPKHILYTTFRKAINELTIEDRGSAEIKNYISLRDTRPKVADNQPFLIPKRSIFNKVIGDNDFELEFASYLDSRFEDVVAFAKNTMGEGGVNFSIEYQREDGGIAPYYPDFFVKTGDRSFFIVETKGREDLDDVRKIRRLKQWCDDVNSIQTYYTYTAIYVKQEMWDARKKDIKLFSDLYKIFEVK